MKTISATNLRVQLRDLLTDLDTGPVSITKHGKVVAVLSAPVVAPAEVETAPEGEGTLEVIATEGPADYTFTVSFGEQSEGGEDGDAPGELSDARSIDISSSLEGNVGDRDSADYYTFTAPGPTFQVTGSSDSSSERGYSITVEDASGSRAAFFRVQPGSEASETIEVDAGSEVRLIVGEGPASYTIDVG